MIIIRKPEILRINLQNGNNCNIWDLDTAANPNLVCIMIDSFPYNGCPQFNFPPIGILLTDCSNVSSCFSITDVTEAYKAKELLKVIDIFGRETKNNPIFYIYDDGTVEKRIVIE